MIRSIHEYSRVPYPYLKVEIRIEFALQTLETKILQLNALFSIAILNGTLSNALSSPLKSWAEVV